MDYQEQRSVTKIYKENYLNGLHRLLNNRRKEAEQARVGFIDPIFEKQEAFRDGFKRMLGWPLSEQHRGVPISVISEQLSEEKGYCVYRMQIEILDDVVMTGLYFRTNGDQKRPLVIVAHGGNDSPELISGVYGDTYNYHNIVHRIRAYGVDVFAPQLLLWNNDYEVPLNRQDLDIRLKRVGSSITAIEVYGIQRILDYFETQEHISSFGMAGLSYGGFYTLYTTAIDTRIRSAISCAYFNKRDAVEWYDWTWFNSAYTFDDAEIACLCYPRKLCLAIADHDELFDPIYGKQSFDHIQHICRNVGTDWVKLIVFNGGHEFFEDDEPIRQLVEDLKAD